MKRSGNDIRSIFSKNPRLSTDTYDDDTLADTRDIEIEIDPSLQSEPKERDTCDTTEMETNESSSTLQIDECRINDIGQLVDPEKTDQEICIAISNPSSSQKYDLLFSHMPPPSVLPSSYGHG
uniref:Uncharacterized protein n=1 Tax=Amphimedon queenslandica TaxID=400682 RepID=A0A1X7U1Q6_AMPQE